MNAETAKVYSNINKYFWITLLQSISFLSPVTTLFYQYRGLSYIEIFMMLLAIVVAMFVAEVPTGMIGDMFGRKTSICIGLLLSMILIALYIFAHSFIFFLILAFLSGVAVTFASGSDEALIYDSLRQSKKEHEMKKIMSRFTAAGFIPVIISAPIGAIIAKDLVDWQFNTLILLSVISVSVAFFIALTLVEPKVPSKKSEKLSASRSPISLFRSALSDIKNSPILVKLFINKTLVLIVCSHVFGVLWQPYLKDSGVPILLFGILIALGAAIIVYLNSNIEKIENHIDDKKLFYYTALVPMIAFILGIFFHNIIYAIIFYLLIRICISIRNPAFSHYTNQHIKSHNRATVLSALSMVDSLFDIIIFIMAGFLTDLGMNYVFIMCASIILIAITFFRIGKEHVETKA